METTTRSRNRLSILPDRLVEARHDAGLSQAELADKVGCALRSLQDWETGVHSPQPRLLRELAHRLNVTVSWLRGLN